MRRPLFVVCLCLVVITGLSAREADRSLLNEKNCIVTGRVYQKDTEYFYLDSIHSIYSERDAAALQQTISFTDNIICERDTDIDVLLGSTVCVCGTFNAFVHATNPGEFDRAEYYHSLGIGGKLQNVTILEQSEKYSGWRELLYEIREYFSERLYEIFPEKEASVMCAMLLGDKKELDADIKHLYQENGIVHILSISGLHITIIGMSIYNMLRKAGMPVWVAAFCGGGILLLYGVMTGMSVSACRAIGMYLLRMISEVVGRTYDMLTALGVMAFIVVWSNPGYLHNAGFYLSFGAVLGIGVLYPVLCREKQQDKVLRYEERRWKRVTDRFAKQFVERLEQSILSGLSISLMTLPVQLWFYYEIPTYSILINLFVIPFMSLVMICGLLAMLVPGLGILGTIDCLILGGYEMLCSCFEQLPYHKWNPGKPEWWQMVVYYLLLVLVLVVRRVWESRGKDSAGRRNKGAGNVTAIQFFLLTISVMVLAFHINKKTTVTFLDVGQGDCICMQLQSGEVYLFDCGSSNRSQVGEYVLKPFLKYYGIDYIDAVFVSHSDKDHCNGVLELLQNQEKWGITIGQLVLTDSENELKVQGEETGTKVLTVKAGDTWSVRENTFLCLHPPKEGTMQDSNAYSQCFYISLSEGVSLLLTGDVESEGEVMLIEELRKRNIQDVTILKVAHHGSKYSTEEAFLRQIQPRAAVISCGADNPYGHPHEETLERLAGTAAEILSTPEYGALTLELGQKPIIRGRKKQPLLQY